MSEENVQCSWPLPPTHYKDATTLTPPSVPTLEPTYIFGRPLHDDYLKQFQMLEEQLPILYDTENLNHKRELKKLNISLLMNFVELIDTLTIDPQMGNEIVVEKIEPIFHNMHHLINTYRPHEARQMLVTMMEKQIERRREFLKSLDENIEFCKKLIGEGNDLLVNAEVNPPELDMSPKDIFSVAIAEESRKDQSVISKMEEKLANIV
eukprot:TRINITY_DN4789_c0_g1_i1.p1 TRINITY_DN4789_c0_g1~~TRINITY_DN4789_c0_g1_i1.p1  ORF type:complete len:208 (-),score=46.94 TRINITY_DN4789_c0_g1_i1:19-642(-)